MILAGLGAIEPSLAVARALEPSTRGSALEFVVHALVRAARYEEALAVAEEIAEADSATHFTITISRPDPLLSGTAAHERARCAVVAGLASVGDTARSLEIARGLADIAARCQALAAVGKEAARRGHLEPAVELITESQSVLRLSAARGGRWLAMSSALSLLTGTQAWEAAGELVEREEGASSDALLDALLTAGEHGRAQEIIERLPIDSRPSALVTAALKAPEASRAEALAEAERVCHTISDDVARVNALRSIARALAASDPRHAQTLLIEAMTIFNGVTEYGTRPTLWPEMFGELVLTGAADEAIGYARSIPAEEDFDGAIALCRINERAMEAGVDLDYIAVLEEAAARADAVSFPPMRADAQARVAVEFARRGMLKRALRGGGEPADRERSRRVARYLADSGRPYEALEVLGSAPPDRTNGVEHAIVRALLEAGDLDRALEVAQTIEPLGDRAQALSAVAERLLLEGQTARAQALASTELAAIIDVSTWYSGQQAALQAGVTAMAHVVGGTVLLERVGERWRNASDVATLASQLIMIAPLVTSRPEVATDLGSSFTWVDHFLLSIDQLG
jgi:tetratricopeptide (TPR) repeat protein